MKLSYFMGLNFAPTGPPPLYVPPPLLLYKASDLPDASNVTTWLNRGTTGAAHNLVAPGSAPTVLATGGKFGGKAIQFGGYGNLLDTLSNVPTIGSAPRVVLARVMFPALSSAVNIFGGGSANSNGTLMDCFVTNGGAIIFHWAGDNSASGAVLTPGQWAVVGIRSRPAPTPGVTMQSSFLGFPDAGIFEVGLGGGGYALNTTPTPFRIGGGGFGPLNGGVTFFLDRVSLSGDLTDEQLTKTAADLATAR